MAKINIDITNKHYNNNERKKFDAFNYKIHKKREKRLKSKDKKPLTECEKFLYENDNFFKDKVIECGDGFFKSNEVSHILLTLTRSKAGLFYDETKEVSKRHPCINYIPSTIMDDSHKKSFLDISNPNRFGLVRVGEFTPNTPDLQEFISLVVVSAFNVSFDAICIDFRVVYTKRFIEEFNNCLIDAFPTDIEYMKLFNAGHYSISYSYPMQESARSQYIDDVLFELKARVCDFLKNNYSVFDFSSNNIPLSIDEYRTDLDYKNRFIASYDYAIFDKNQLLDFNFLDKYSNSKKGLVFLDYNNAYRRSFYDLNRHRLLFFVSDDENVYMHDSFDFILLFFLQKQMIKRYNQALNSKYELFEKIGNGDYHSISRIYKDYCNLCMSINNMELFLIFNKLELLSLFLNNSLLKKLFNNNEKDVNLLNKRNEDLDKKMNNILTSKNNSASIKIAFCALIVSSLSAIAAIIAIIFR